MSSVAERLGVAKADLLDPTSSDAAVKQAHGDKILVSAVGAIRDGKFAQSILDEVRSSICGFH